MPSGEIVIRLVDGGRAESTTTTKSGGKKSNVLKEEKEKNKKIREAQKREHSIHTYQLQQAELDDRLRSAAFSYLANNLAQTAKTSFNFYAQNVGRWTGDARQTYNVQQISAGFNVLSSITESMQSIGLAALSGATIGGPVGAAIGIGIATIKVGASHLSQATNYNVGIASDNRSVLFAKQIAGNEITNWSR